MNCRFPLKWMILMGCVLLASSQDEPIDSAVLENIFNVFGENPNAPMVETTTAVVTIVNDDGVECICVPYHLCDPATNTTITTGENDGFGQLDTRFNANECTVSVDVCCAESQAPTPEKPPIVVQPSPKQGCGIRNVGGLDVQLISDDPNDAGIYEFPWIVAILRNDAEKRSVCGSTLIHPQVVLTAAHCVKDLRPRDILIRAGEWDTQTSNERLPHQERQVVRIIAHPRHSSKTQDNDIALLILSIPLTIGDNINTICLPNQDESFDSVKECMVAGWGKKNFGKAGRYSVIMKRIFLDMVEFASCEAKLKRTRLGPRFNLKDSFVCAGGVQGVDACEGDGGAPLACPTSDDRYTQAGIVSWGIGCGQKDVPGVYAKVSKYRRWIDDQVTRAGYDTLSYTPSN